jgi:hypothetical protein
MEERNGADMGMHGSTTHASPDAEIARDFDPVSYLGCTSDLKRRRTKPKIETSVWPTLKFDFAERTALLRREDCAPAY